ncbi:BLUF domain-containing protein [Paracoccus sediminicola]|uniref:BLUF domain-containing protein n=1 Tax=Paracoccus sediminicola TaxID=3017783 RepID=UPI0022F139E4|nr:BLUF domain-containing protein [Paracoccus sediminicola]WBU57783.1 BLUF domain-containing protein [Paracoccus sediminicola]
MAFSHILYRSSGRLDQFDKDCQEILRTARKRNKALGLTGFLHAEDGMFVQWLEGPDDALNEVIESLQADKRHRDLTVYASGPIAERRFPSWTMGYSNGEQAPLFDYLAEQGTNSHDLRRYGECLYQFLALRAA